jgi:AraC-like DNA-binding protein
MMKFISARSIFSSDLSVFRCGSQDMTADESWGPDAKECFMIYQVTSGKLVFRNQDVTLVLKERDTVVSYPNTITYLQVVSDTATFLWVGFHGEQADHYLQMAGVTEKPRIIQDRHGVIQASLLQMMELDRVGEGREFAMLGNLYLLLSGFMMKQEGPPQSQWNMSSVINKAVQYVEYGMVNGNTSIVEMAKHIGISRSYLHVLFQKHLGMSPQKFVIHYKVNRACELLKHNQRMTISNISRSVGYEDPLLFSKIFKKIKSISPSAYRTQENTNK